MKIKLLIISGLAAFFLTSTEGLTQSGGPGGRFPGGSGGDPNERFNQMTNGKDVWIRAQTQDPWSQRMFDRIADQIGVTNGQITRQQYLAYQEQRAADRASRRGSGGPPSDAARGSGGPSPSPDGGGFGGRRGNRDSAEAMFSRLDLNGDGYLNYDEMPDDLRIEKQKWDTDRNGLIDLSEFKAYYQARVQPAQADRGTPNQQQWPGVWPNYFSWDSASPPEEERKPPVVYRPGKLPKELPSWFAQLDTDQDGQIGLYEWKASGRSLQEFDEMDRNKDGFLTVDEVLRFTNKGKENAGQSPWAQQGYAFNGGDYRNWGRGFGPPGFGPPGFGPPFGGRDRGGRDFSGRGGRGGMRNRGGPPQDR